MVFSYGLSRPLYPVIVQNNITSCNLLWSTGELYTVNSITMLIVGVDALIDTNTKLEIINCVCLTFLTKIAQSIANDESL